MPSSQIKHSEKMLFPISGITKGNLIDYYNSVAGHILPYLKDRPLTLHRFPNGIAEEGFFQKNASDYFPQWIKTVKVKKKDGWVNHVICNNKETLAYLAYQGTITFHISLSKIDKLDYPDRLIFDLDPSGHNFGQVLKGVQILRSLLAEQLGLPTYVMTTGSKGLHLTIPLMRVEHFDEVRDFAKKVATYLAEKHPEDFTIAIHKDERKGRLFLDYLRNSYGQTAVCPYSVRALENAPVATPIFWKELYEIKDAQAFNIHTVPDRLKHMNDPWENFTKNAVILSDAKKSMAKLISG
ncbi:non-homologous end-joining DNA ligase [Maribacter polysiphoniae]|uniref:Non-homologous end-joining DNA ligase n=2 Tax=Maribacter polysiphoniae TaxID=429344 RepID=A0ABR7VUU9_9FLAO|nr:non-homologous end-joining DNA ligase [Maribacter polysiphoniae]MBD1259772.1 non-homologous end-joining DNA ligase [Maribacter polysiphoniae]